MCWLLLNEPKIKIHTMVKKRKYLNMPSNFTISLENIDAMNFYFEQPKFYCTFKV